MQRGKEIISVLTFCILTYQSRLKGNGFPRGLRDPHKERNFSVPDVDGSKINNGTLIVNGTQGKEYEKLQLDYSTGTQKDFIQDRSKYHMVNSKSYKKPRERSTYIGDRCPIIHFSFGGNGHHPWLEKPQINVTKSRPRRRKETTNEDEMYMKINELTTIPIDHHAESQIFLHLYNRLRSKENNFSMGVTSKLVPNLKIHSHDQIFGGSKRTFKFTQTPVSIRNSKSISIEQHDFSTDKVNTPPKIYAKEITNVPKTKCGSYGTDQKSRHYFNDLLIKDSNALILRSNQTSESSTFNHSTGVTYLFSVNTQMFTNTPLPFQNDSFQMINPLKLNEINPFDYARVVGSYLTEIETNSQRSTPKDKIYDVKNQGNDVYNSHPVKEILIKNEWNNTNKFKDKYSYSPEQFNSITSLYSDSISNAILTRLLSGNKSKTNNNGTESWLGVGNVLMIKEKILSNGEKENIFESKNKEPLINNKFYSKSLQPLKYKLQETTSNITKHSHINVTNSSTELLWDPLSSGPGMLNRDEKCDLPNLEYIENQETEFEKSHVDLFENNDNKESHIFHTTPEFLYVTVASDRRSKYNRMVSMKNSVLNETLDLPTNIQCQSFVSNKLGTKQRVEKSNKTEEDIKNLYDYYYNKNGIGENKSDSSPFQNYYNLQSIIEKLGEASFQTFNMDVLGFKGFEKLPKLQYKEFDKLSKVHKLQGNVLRNETNISNIRSSFNKNYNLWSEFSNLLRLRGNSSLLGEQQIKGMLKTNTTSPADIYTVKTYLHGRKNNRINQLSQSIKNCDLINSIFSYFVNNSKNLENRSTLKYYQNISSFCNITTPDPSGKLSINLGKGPILIKNSTKINLLLEPLIASNEQIKNSMQSQNYDPKLKAYSKILSTLFDNLLQNLDRKKRKSVLKKNPRLQKVKPRNSSAFCKHPRRSVAEKISDPNDYNSKFQNLQKDLIELQKAIAASKSADIVKNVEKNLTLQIRVIVDVVNNSMGKNGENLDEDQLKKRDTALFEDKNKLNEWCEVNNIIPEEQSGFRKKIGHAYIICTFCIASLIVLQTQVRKQYLLAMFVDLRRALDNKKYNLHNDTIPMPLDHDSPYVETEDKDVFQVWRNKKVNNHSVITPKKNCNHMEREQSNNHDISEHIIRNITDLLDNLLENYKLHENNEKFSIDKRKIKSFGPEQKFKRSFENLGRFRSDILKSHKPICMGEFNFSKTLDFDSITARITDSSLLYELVTAGKNLNNVTGYGFYNSSEGGLKNVNSKDTRRLQISINDTIMELNNQGEVMTRKTFEKPIPRKTTVDIQRLETSKSKREFKSNQILEINTNIGEKNQKFKVNYKYPEKQKVHTEIIGKEIKINIPKYKSEDKSITIDNEKNTHKPATKDLKKKVEEGIWQKINNLHEPFENKHNGEETVTAGVNSIVCLPTPNVSTPKVSLLNVSTSKVSISNVSTTMPVDLGSFITVQWCCNEMPTTERVKNSTKIIDTTLISSNSTVTSSTLTTKTK